MDKIECAKGSLLVGLHSSIDGALSSMPHKSGLKVSISVPTKTTVKKLLCQPAGVLPARFLTYLILVCSKAR